MIPPCLATQSGTSKLDLMSFKLGFHISWEKNKLKHVGGSPGPPPITAGIITVKFMNSCNYLGSTVTNTGELHEEITSTRVLLQP